MAKKKELKNKSVKSGKAKYKKVKKAVNGLPDGAKVTLAVTAFVLVVAFLIVCYLNPAIYINFLNLFKEKEESHITQIVGDDVYVDELSDVEVHFVNVGQGDSIVIKLPDEAVVLIDAYNDDVLFDYLKNTLKLTTIDYVLATHSDNDHIGAMDKIFNNFEVKKVFRPYIKYVGSIDIGDIYNLENEDESKVVTTNVYGNFLQYLSKETYFDGTEIKDCEWEFFNYDSDFSRNIHYNNKVYTYTFDFLTPTVSVEDIEYEDVNSYSPIIKFSYSGTDVLLTGDAENEALDEFIGKYTSKEDKEYLDVEILKVGHHGSKTSTTQPLLDLIKPEVAVISCGEGNSYKHPHKEVLDLFLNHKENGLDALIALYRTDLNGNIVLNISTTGFKFELENSNLFPNMYDAPV